MGGGKAHKCTYSGGCGKGAALSSTCVDPDLARRFKLCRKHGLLDHGIGYEQSEASKSKRSKRYFKNKGRLVCFDCGDTRGVTLDPNDCIDGKPKAKCRAHNSLSVCTHDDCIRPAHTRSVGHASLCFGHWRLAFPERAADRNDKQNKRKKDNRRKAVKSAKVPVKAAPKPADAKAKAAPKTTDAKAKAAPKPTNAEAEAAPKTTNAKAKAAPETTNAEAKAAPETTNAEAKAVSLTLLERCKPGSRVSL